MSDINNTPRRRRSDPHRAQTPKNPENKPQRAGFPPDDTAPMPLGGYDAARPAAPIEPPRETGPNYRSAPRVYEEDAYLPPRRDPREYEVLPYDGEYDDDDPPRRRWPLVLLALILLAALALAASYFFVPKDTSGILGTARGISHSAVDGAMGLLGIKPKEAPALIKFETADSEVVTGVKTVFTFTSTQSIEDVRVSDEAENVIQGIRVPEDAPLNTTWTLSAILDEPMDGLLTAWILHEGTWIKTDKTLPLMVLAKSEAPEPLFTPTLIPEPSQRPVITNAPTLAPAVILSTAPSTAPALTPSPSPASVLSTPPAVSGGRAALLTAVPAAAKTEAPAQGPESNPQGPEVTASSIAELLPVFSPVPLSLTTAAPVTQAPIYTLPLKTPEATASNPLPFEMPGDQADDLAEMEAPEEMPGEFEAEPLDETQAEPEAPEATPQPLPATPAPTPTMMPPLSVAASESNDPARFDQTEDAYQGSKKLDGFTREQAIQMQGDGLYTYYKGGVFTFRGDAFRQNASFGTAEMPLEEMSIEWKTEVGSLRTDNGTLYGVGYTGQPAIIKWSIEVRAMMNLNEDKKDVKALKEVIFAAQDGKVYFLDLNDGLPTREAIDIGFPLKGSVAVDAIGRPMIAFGQGISILPGKTGDIGYYIYNLVDQSQLFFINGRKTKSQVQYATNGAFDGTGLFDRFSDSLVIAGENGLLYTVKLNTVFDYKDLKTITIDPEITYLRGKGKQNDTTVSVESSVAMYGPYAYFADKQGFIRCVDTTTMETVWMFDAGDNTDAAPALEFDENDGLALYTGTTVFTRTRKSGNAVMRRLDALTGEEVWAHETSAKFDDGERGGVKASPVVGQQNIEGLVLFAVNETPEGGTLLALYKETGELAWSAPISGGAVSSPVAVYDLAGKARVIQAGLDGKLYMFNGLTGQLLSTLDLGGTIEGSPAVYSDMLVIGTSDRENSFMYGIRIE